MVNNTSRWGRGIPYFRLHEQQYCLQAIATTPCKWYYYTLVTLCWRYVVELEEDDEVKFVGRIWAIWSDKYLALNNLLSRGVLTTSHQCSLNFHVIKVNLSYRKQHTGYLYRGADPFVYRQGIAIWHSLVQKNLHWIISLEWSYRRFSRNLPPERGFAASSGVLGPFCPCRLPWVLIRKSRKYHVDPWGSWCWVLFSISISTTYSVQKC